MIGCIIQARMGSTRLPGKVLKKLNGKIPILEFQMNQLKFSKNIDKIIIATTTQENDEQIIDFCKKKNLEYFRGESKDVLDRYYKCAKKFNFSTIVRITSDNPLIDPTIVDNAIEKFIDTEYDYLQSNMNFKKDPLGFTVEVFTFNSIEKAWKEANLPSEHEHVTSYFYNNPDKFIIKTLTQEKDFSHISCTVDTEYDFRLIEKIVSKIKSRPIYQNDILELFQDEPVLLEINNHVKHDGYARSLKEDETFLN